MNDVSFDNYFSPSFLENIFKEKLLFRNGGGRDRMTPKKYWSVIGGDVRLLSEQCLNGSYKFCYYNELLYIKNANSYPRIISVPTVRDRLILCALNLFLQEIFPECVNHHIPSYYINEIRNYLKAHNEEDITYVKTDFTSFYNSINQTRLLSILRKRISDERPLQLILNAIQTPTVEIGAQCKNSVNAKGVPQGLAISNILAAIYMHEFDCKFINSNLSGVAIRYVDDMLFINPDTDKLLDQINSFIDECDMDLTTNKEKTSMGYLNESGIDFIGYVITQTKISARKRNITRYVDRLAKTCRKFEIELKSEKERPLFLKDKQELIRYYIDELNSSISGFKYGNRLYGWLPYYRQVTDVSLFFQLDKILKRLLRNIKNVDFSMLHSFVDSHYAIIEQNGGKLVMDFDRIETIEAKKLLLMRKGIIKEEHEYDNPTIDYLFQQYCQRRVAQEEKNIGYFN